jgi:hypothetical protein
MDALQDDNVLVVTAFFVVCTGALAFLRWWAVRRARSESISRGAEQAVAAFGEQVALLRKKRSVLEAHLNEYFNTFQEAGWPELVQLLVDLGQAEEELYSILDNGRYEEASQLANLLLERLSHENAKTASKRFSTSSSLVDWRERAEVIVTRLVETLEDAASKTHRMGISRQRKRQSTRLALHEIRNLNLRDRQH